MISCRTGRRQRRVVWWSLLCIVAGAYRVAAVAAQETVGPNPFRTADNAAPQEAAYQPGAEPSACTYGCGLPCENSAQCGCAEACHSGIFAGGWIGAEWLHWHLDGSKLPPLVTDGSVNTARNEVARLDDPGTRILSGNEIVNDDWRDGYRLFGGIWLDCCHCCGIGGDYFNTGNDDYDFTSHPNAFRIVGRPFFNTELGHDDVEFVSIPNELDGTAHVHSSDNLQGAGLTLNHCLWQCCDPCCNENSSQVALLGGYRFYQYDSNLSITENLTVLPGTQTLLVPGTTILVQDSFRVKNEFNGGEIGVQGTAKHCWWWLDGMAKLAIGEEDRTVTINGQTVTTVPNAGTSTAAGGLLTAEPTNIGQYHDSSVAVIPEFRLGAGAMVTCHCALHVGYDVIVWSDLTRAASELPPRLDVDPQNLPPVQSGGGADPRFPGFRGSQLVAQGVDLSVTWQF